STPAARRGCRSSAWCRVRAEPEAREPAGDAKRRRSPLVPCGSAAGGTYCRAGLWAPLREPHGAAAFVSRRPPRAPPPNRHHPALMANPFRRVSLTQWIFIGMFSGILLGYFFPDGERALHGGWSASDLKLLSDLFVRGIKMIIAPILFSTLVMGIAGHGDDLRKVGRLAFRSILYFEIVTTVALVVGLT